MRILHVIASMEPVNGGPSQGIRNLDKVMKDMGVTREVVCLDAPGSTYLKNDTFKTHALGLGWNPWHYESNLTTWLTDNLLKFDIIIINGLWQYHSYATWKVINKLKKDSPGKKLPRVLIMPHGMLDPYFQRAKERWLKAIRNRIYWKLIESKVINDADGLLFTCETELIHARETFKGYFPKREFNVGYGIEGPPLYTEMMGIAFNECCPNLNGEPYLLFLSRIHSKKGLDMLIEAYTKIYKESNSIKSLPKIVIAGPGLNTRFGKSLLDQLSKNSEVKSNFFFTGMLLGDAKWGAFYGCEAFILPSHQENFGIAVVEALACGKPVLISNQVNIWQEIAAEGAGIIEDDNLQGVENLLTKWISMTESERTQMSEKAVLGYQHYFTVNKIAKNFLDVFDEFNGLVFPEV